MGHDSFRHISKRPDEGLKTVPSALRAPIRNFPRGQLQGCLMMAQGSAKRGPRGFQNGPESAPKGNVDGPRGGGKSRTLPPFIDRLQDGPNINISSLSRPKACRKGGPGVSPETSSLFTILKLRISTVSRMEGEWFSTCGSRLSAARTCLNNLQTLFRMEGGSFFKLWLSFWYDVGMSGRSGHFDSWC
eukprot:9494104-Pyramimonas_sp.AAC.1